MNKTVPLMLAAVVLTATFVVLPAAEDNPARPEPAKAQRCVNLVICLDTSGSMSGLIESAKQKLWAIVNELATARPRPKLRVGLYQYGNDGLDSGTGWVQRICELTEDLDTVYGKLFALKTNGGTEYVARVVRSAARELDWDKDRGTLKMIFVAGNEAATQDKEYKLKDICKEAISKGIIVNSIFCGPTAEGRKTGWADVAAWTDGRYAAIDQDSGTVAIQTPYDKKLSELGEQLNKTYVAYGAKGQAGKANQAAQDTNAAKLGAPAGAQRAAAKSTLLYNNASWDLVDAVKQNSVDMEKLKTDELPEGMRKMSREQRKAYLDKQYAERQRLQKEIQDLHAKRQEHVKKEMAKQGLSEAKAFDAVLRAAVREQAAKKGFEFKGGEQAPPPSK